MKFQLLQELSSLEEFREKDRIEMSVKGWNHPKDWYEKFILPELNDYYSESTFKLLEKEETGYASLRYQEGQDAHEEGYSCWIDFQEYRKGLGKVTIYTIQILDAEVKS